LGAYDVGLDHSDRLGRVTELRFASSYAHDDLSALLEVYVQSGLSTGQEEALTFMLALDPTGRTRARKCS
jgi:hypothetical protein